MSTLELWRWRYRDPANGTVQRTDHVLTEGQALARWPDAERIEGTRQLRSMPDEGRAEEGDETLRNGPLG